MHHQSRQRFVFARGYRRALANGTPTGIAKFLPFNRLTASARDKDFRSRRRLVSVTQLAPSARCRSGSLSAPALVTTLDRKYRSLSTLIGPYRADNMRWSGNLQRRICCASGKVTARKMYWEYEPVHRSLLGNDIECRAKLSGKTSYKLQTNAFTLFALRGESKSHAVVFDQK